MATNEMIVDKEERDLEATDFSSDIADVIPAESQICKKAGIVSFYVDVNLCTKLVFFQ